MKNEQLKAGDTVRVMLRVEILRRVDDDTTLKDEMDMARAEVADSLLSSQCAAVSVLQGWKEPGAEELWPERPR